MNTLFSATRRAATMIAAAACAVSLFGADVRVYVQFAPGQRAAAQAALAQAGARAHHEFENLNAFAVTLPEPARTALERNPVVLLIEEDPVRGFLAQTVPYGITMVQAPAAVSAGATGKGIMVGVVDSGVYSGHEDLKTVAIAGEPDHGANDQRTWYRDHLAHGTHVVGTIAAANNGFGVIGVSPGDVSVYMVKVFGDSGNWIYSSDLVTAARAAANKGAKIVSMSLGGSRSSVIEQQGMNDLYTNKGVLLVAAAGNSGNTATSYPAGYASVISVAAIDSNKNVASFSQKNSTVELAAPGVAVLSTVSSVETCTVAVGGTTREGNHVEYAARGSATGGLVFGGLGDTTNPAWAGKVVLVDRGSITFNEKVRNVQSSGGVACVIANNVSGGLSATLGSGNSSTIPAVTVSLDDGVALKSHVGSSATVISTFQQPGNGYDVFDGTSMATPHVAGVAALIWSKRPTATNVEVRQALIGSAQDLGAAGRDNSYGYGLVQAKAALDALVGTGGGTAPGPDNGNTAPTDTTAPIISNVADAVNSKNGKFQITWTTNEPATSDVKINGTDYPSSTLTTNHSRTFRGSKGATYIYYVSSRDAAGNTATSGPYTIEL